MPMARRPKFLAATRVVPLPQNGSSTQPFVNVHTKYSNNSVVSQFASKTTSNFVTVLMETSHSRLVARRLLPSTSMPNICVRFSMGRRFMTSIIISLPMFVKHKIHFDDPRFVGGALHISPSRHRTRAVGATIRS